MDESLQSVSLVFVTSVPFELEAVLQRLHSFTADSSVNVTHLSVDEALGAVSSEKIVSVVLAVSLNVGYSMVGNAVYDALKAAPSVQCVVGDSHVSTTEAKDHRALESKVRKAAKPHRRHGAGH